MPLVDIRHQAQRHNATELLLHMQRFSLDLKFSVSLASLSPPPGRFHDSYREPLTTPERLEMLGEVREDNVLGVEVLYPNEINEDNVEIFKTHAKATGQRVISIQPNLHYQRAFEYGSLANPEKSVRRMAIDRLVGAMEMTRELDGDFALLWPGIDGFENSFGLNFFSWRDRFADGLVEAMERVPGVRVALLPKPGDPRGHQFIASVSDALIMCARADSRLRAEESAKCHSDGHALATVCVKASHIAMAGEDLPDALSKAMEQGRLSHIRWSSQPRGSQGLELNVSVANPEQTKAGLYGLKMCGYTGLFGLDIQPLRMNPIRALRNSMDAIRVANDLIEEMDHEHILHCSAYPQVDRGWIEAYLNRRRAPHPERLWPLGPPIKGDDHAVE